MYRQGDVLLIPVADTVVTKAIGQSVPRDRGRVVLAYGEVTGHAHAIHAEGVSLWQVGTDGRLLVVPETAELVHEEHDTITLPPGTYRVVQQREYTPERIRPVLD